MDNFVFTMEKSYNYMLEEINEILDGTIYSDNERKRLFYACGSCLHLILDFAERIDISEKDREYISAFRFANNALKHDKDLFDFTEETGGISFPITFPLVIPKKEVRWKKLENNGKFESQYNNYVKYLEKQPIIDTYKKAIDMLLRYNGK